MLPSNWLTALQFDIDAEGGGARIEAELPAPNAVVINPLNVHPVIYPLGGWIFIDSGEPYRLPDVS